MYSGFGAIDPFALKQLPDGKSYRSTPVPFRSAIKGALIGWKVRGESQQDVGHPGGVPMKIHFGKTEVAKMTPYTESTGPRDVGDGFRWVEQRWKAGRGIIIVPPVELKLVPDFVALAHSLMHMKIGNLTVIATEDPDVVAASAGAGKRGFVLYEPKAGWKKPSVTPVAKAGLVPLLAVAGVVGLVGLGAYAFTRRR